MKLSNSMKKEQDHLHCTSQYTGFWVSSFSQAQCHSLPAQQTRFVPTTEIHYPRGCGHLLLCINMYFLFLKTFPNVSGVCRKLLVSFVFFLLK